jgi:hypothetical protein
MPGCAVSIRSAGVLLALAGAGQAIGAGPFGASINLSSLNGTTGFVCTGIDAGDFSGSSVASAGDINGDGYDDVIIGALLADPSGQASAGETYVVFGKATGFAPTLTLSALTGANGFVLNGIDPNDRSGGAVSSAGDVNGDGFDDLIIGATYASPIGRTLAGESYVVFGGPTVGAGGSINLSSLNGTDGFVIAGAFAYDASGCAVSSAGDMNGDGYDDVIIGAFSADPSGQNNAGASHVVFGGPAVGAGGLVDLALLSGADGFALSGIDPNDTSGRAVSGAGDVNGDGFDDVVIGAPSADPNGQSGAGESYVVFGGPAVGAGGVVDLSSLNGANGFTLNGIDAGDLSGRSASRAGDVNGDGYGDLIIGASSADPSGQSDAGEAYVVFGGPLVGAAGVVNLASLNGATGFLLSGIDASDNAGHAVSSAGDANGDGYDDLLIGVPYGDPSGRSGAGESCVVFGGPTVGAGGVVALSSLTGINGFVLNGADADDFSGRPVSRAGDVNGDGIDDLLIASSGADPAGLNLAGESSVVFGRPGQVWTSPSGGSWDAGAKWLSGFAPTRGIVVIDTPIGITVTGPADAVFLEQLTVGADVGRTTLSLQPDSVVAIAGGHVILPSAALAGSGTLSVESSVFSVGLIAPTDLTIVAPGNLTNANDIRIETFAPSATPKALTVFGPIQNFANAEIVIRGAAVLESTSTITNAGTISIGFADASIYGALTNNVGALISIAGGSQAIFADNTANFGEIELTTDSALLIFGTLSINGVTGPGGGASGPVYVEGGILPGPLLGPGVAFFGGNVTLGSAGTTTIEIGGATPGTSHDQIASLGGLGAAGALHVNLINGYIPQPGDAYVILDAGSITGTFASIVLDPVLVTAGADTSTLYIDGTIRIPGAPACTGDINNDGFTNAADFVILAGNFGASVTPNTSGDLNGDGLVNASDFVILAGDFGCVE